MKDKVSSLIVKRTSSMGDAYGTWVGITSTEVESFTIHYGFSTSYSSGETLNQQYTMSYEMTSGINLKVVKDEEKISDSYTYGIQKDAESHYSDDVSAKVTIKCTAKAASDGVGLW